MMRSDPTWHLHMFQTSIKHILSASEDIYCPWWTAGRGILFLISALWYLLTLYSLTHDLKRSRGQKDGFGPGVRGVCGSQPGYIHTSATPRGGWPLGLTLRGCYSPPPPVSSALAASPGRCNHGLQTLR